MKRFDLAAIGRNRWLWPMVGLVVVAGAAVMVADKHRWAGQTLAEIEPRHARLVGLEASKPDLDTLLADRRAVLARNVYPSSQDVARAGSDAQQRARETFTAAGMTVSSTQVLPPKAIDGFDRIPLSMRLEGELPALQNALASLAAQAPSIFVEGLNAQTLGMPRPEAASRLNVQVTLFVLRGRS